MYLLSCSLPHTYKATEFPVKAKSGKLAPNEYQSGTFTISNMGGYSTHTALGVGFKALTIRKLYIYIYIY